MLMVLCHRRRLPLRARGGFRGESPSYLWIIIDYLLSLSCFGVNPIWITNKLTSVPCGFVRSNPHSSAEEVSGVPLAMAIHVEPAVVGLSPAKDNYPLLSKKRSK